MREVGISNEPIYHACSEEAWVYISFGGDVGRPTQLLTCRFQFANNTPMNINELTPTQLRQAADLKEQIEKLQNQLVVLGGSGSGMPSPFKKAKPAKRKMSAAARAKIAAAQKARWAKQKGITQTVKTIPAPKPAKGKSGMSAEGKARIVAAQKARWAAIKAGKKPAIKAAKPAKKKFTMSAAAKAKISAAAKARWAKIKGAKEEKK